MTPSHAKRKGKAYRYYVSKALINGSNPAHAKGRRIPAGDIEGLVERYMIQLLKRQATLHHMLEPYVANALERQSLINAASLLASRWPRLGVSTKRIILNNLIARIDIRLDTIELQIRPQQLPGILEGKDTSSTSGTIKNKTGDTLTISLPARLRRAGLETKLVIDADGSGAHSHLALKAPDPYLHRLIAKSHAFQVIFLRGGASISAMAEEAGVSSSYFTRTLRYSFLAPDITRAIIAGKQPVQLTARRLKSHPKMPGCWNEQRRSLEFD